MAKQRFVIEGEWSGYRATQRKVVHRTVTRIPQRYEKLRCIEYTDGTTLTVSVRPCEPREQVREIHGYDSLIEEAADHGSSYVRVADLGKPAAAARGEQG